MAGREDVWLEHDRSHIERWSSAGLLAGERVLERLSSRISSQETFSSSELGTLSRAFEHGARPGKAGSKVLAQESFITHLQSRHLLLDGPAAQDAGPVLFRSVAYLAGYPFSARGSAGDGLTLEGLARGLAWALPGRHASFLEEGSQSRVRTAADHRRLIFQSLATAGDADGLPYDAAEARRLAAENATEGVDPALRDLAAPNHDGDGGDGGDEIHTDLLEVLYSTQPDQKPGVATVHYRSFAEATSEVREQLDRLYRLAIPYGRFKVLAKVLLAAQFERKDALEAVAAASQAQAADDDDLDRAAEAVARAFCPDKESGITWPAFDRAMKNTAPYFFTPLYHILSLAFLETPCKEATDRSPPPALNAGAILGVPGLAQLSTFLSESVYFGDLRRQQRYAAAAADLPPAAVVVQQLKAVAESAVLVVSGSSDAGVRQTFGAFLPVPAADGGAIQRPREAHYRQALLFQLAPTQDVFRGVVGEPAWTLRGDDVCFGKDMKGAVMLLRDGLKSCVFANNDHGPDGESYSPTRWRGAWSAEFKVEYIEIWGEISS